MEARLESGEVTFDNFDELCMDRRETKNQICWNPEVHGEGQLE